MWDDLSDLYQTTILDHCAHPHNFGEMKNANYTAHGHNPLCGDNVVVYVRVQDGIIEEVKFSGDGCAISKASSSIMTDELCGKTIDEALVLFERFHILLTEDASNETAASLGKLAVFSGVKQFPARVKCATLAWHTLKAALEAKESTISTE